MLEDIKSLLPSDISLDEDEKNRLLTLLINRVSLYLFGDRPHMIINPILYSIIAEMFIEQYKLVISETNGIEKIQDGQQSVWYTKMNASLLSAKDNTLFSSHTSILNRFRVLSLIGD